MGAPAQLELCPELAQSRSSGVLHSRSGHRRITDVSARMSVHRRIADAKPSGAEGRSLTQLGHSGRVVATARSGLLAPLGDCLDMAKADIAAGISDTRNVRDCGSCLIVRLGSEAARPTGARSGLGRWPPGRGSGGIGRRRGPGGRGRENRRRRWRRARRRRPAARAAARARCRWR